MDIIVTQAVFGIALFFIINWIGKHSYSLGYLEISIFVKIEDAPAFNFLIRVLSPVVYIVLISTILYYFKLDEYVNNIYMVNLYYIIFRLGFNLITNRGVLLDWYRQLSYWTTILLISYFVYDKLIKIKANILPDFTTIANELWIIIFIFIFQIANNIRFSNDTTYKRRQHYLESRYRNFKRIYGTHIKEIANNDAIEIIIYSILIYEDFNRPKVFRKLENLKHLLSKKSHTLGVMQVRSDILLSDLESLKLGANKIVNDLKTYIRNLILTSEEFDEYSAQYYIISQYNGGSNYFSGISEIMSIIKTSFYADSTDALNTEIDI